MISSAKQILGHGAIYAIGIAVRNVSSLIMLPIYTQYLIPADYGTIELLSMIVDLVAIFVGMRVGFGVFRYYGLTTDESERKKIVNSAIVMIALFNIIGVLLVMGFSTPLSSMVFGDEVHSRVIAIFSATLLFTALSEVPMAYLQLQERPWLYVAASMLKLALQLSFNIYFVVYLNLGVEGVIYSALCSSGIFALVMLVYTFLHTGLAVSLSVVKSLVSFSFPLMLAAVGMFYISSVDRYLLRVFEDLSAVGIYSLAYKFGFILIAIVAAPFMAVWEPMRYRIYREGQPVSNFNDVLRFYTMFLSVAWLGLSMFAEDLLVVMSDPEFWGAAQVVPWVVMAYVFQCWTEYCNFGVMLKGQTGQVTRGAFLGGVVITVVAVFAIPEWGALGAGVATLCAFVTRFFWVYFASQRCLRIPFRWHTIIGFPVLAVGLYVLSLWAPQDILLSVGFKLLIATAYLLLILITPLTSREEKLHVLRFLREPVQTLKSLRN